MLGLPMSEIDELRIAADLHDIGKRGISEEILMKPSSLTKEEYNQSIYRNSGNINSLRH